MEKFVTFLLTTEEEAFKASREIVNLGNQGEIKINELFILTRKENGEVKILDVKRGKIPYSASGGVIGGLLGILGGPLGVLFGMTTGLMAGGIGDLIRMSKSKKFIDKASKAIPEGQTVILGNIVESWEVPLNTTLKPYDVSIQRISVDDALAKFAEEEKLKVQKNIQQIEEKISTAEGEAKENLQQELTKLQDSYAILDQDTSTESSERKFSNWMDKVKSNLVKFKDNISDYFDDEKDELIDEYHDLREEYRELNYKIKSALKRLETADENNFKSTLDYLREEVREFDEEVKELKVEISKLRGDDKIRWEEKLANMLEKRNELIEQVKLKIEAYSKRNFDWIYSK